MSRGQLKRLQRRTVDAKKALKSAQSQTRFALQLVAQLEHDISAALTDGHAQPQEAEHDTAEEELREVVPA